LWEKPNGISFVREVPVNRIEWERLGCFQEQDIERAIVSFGGYIPFELVIFDTTSFDSSKLDKFAAKLKENLCYMGSRILIVIKDSVTPNPLNGVEKTCAICSKDDVSKSIKSSPAWLWPGILRCMWLKNYTGSSDLKLYLKPA
jgi:hypothetical protein